MKKLPQVDRQPQALLSREKQTHQIIARYIHEKLPEQTASSVVERKTNRCSRPWFHYLKQSFTAPLMALK
jgi:hypothetical protein